MVICASFIFHIQLNWLRWVLMHVISNNNAVKNKCLFIVFIYYFAFLCPHFQFRLQLTTHFFGCHAVVLVYSILICFLHLHLRSASSSRCSALLKERKSIEKFELVMNKKLLSNPIPDIGKSRSKGLRVESGNRCERLHANPVKEGSSRADFDWCLIGDSARR